MKRLFFLFPILIFMVSCEDDSPNSTTLTLKPGPAEGKDSQIFSGDPDGNEDLGTDRRDLVANEWIFTSTPESKYSLIDFDLSEIPDGVTIESALLILYHDAGSFDEGHSLQSGSNELRIERIISPWDETTSWNDRPNTTAINASVTASSVTATDNYEIQIGLMVRDYLADPDNSYGFQLRMNENTPFRSVVFASSDHPDANLHPELRIRYR